MWVPEDTAEPLPLLSLRLSPENRRYLDAAGVFIQFSHSQKLSNSISQVNLSIPSVFCLIYTLTVDSCGVHSELGIRYTSSSHLCCVFTVWSWESH